MKGKSALRYSNYTPDCIELCSVQEYNPEYRSTVLNMVRSIVRSAGVRFGVPEYRSLGVPIPSCTHSMSIHELNKW